MEGRRKVAILLPSTSTFIVEEIADTWVARGSRWSCDPTLTTHRIDLPGNNNEISHMNGSASGQGLGSSSAIEKEHTAHGLHPCSHGSLAEMVLMTMAGVLCSLYLRPSDIVIQERHGIR